MPRIRNIASRRSEFPSSLWKKIKVPSIIGVTDEMPAPGLAEFTLDGKTLQLEPVLEDPDAKQLFFILRDTTSRPSSSGPATSYGALPLYGFP